MQTPALLVKTHLLKIKIGHLRDLRRSNEKVFGVVVVGVVFYSNNSYLYPLVVNHIYIYAFSRRFYPKRLTVHSVCPFYFVSMFFFLSFKLSCVFFRACSGFE